MRLECVEHTSVSHKKQVVLTFLSLDRFHRNHLPLGNFLLELPMFQGSLVEQQLTLFQGDRGVNFQLAN